MRTIKAVELERNFNGKLVIQEPSPRLENYQFGIANIPRTQEKVVSSIQAKSSSVVGGALSDNTRKALQPVFSSLERLVPLSIKGTATTTCKQKVQVSACQAEIIPSVIVIPGDNDFEKNNCDQLKEFCGSEWEKVLEGESVVQNILEEVGNQSPVIDAFFKNFDEGISLNNAVLLSVPDQEASDEMPMVFIRGIRKGERPILNPPLVCGDTPECDRKKIREFVAFTFESLVRTAIAGSEQLKVDRAEYVSASVRQEKVYGIYHGVRPDLFKGVEKSGFLNPFYFSGDRDLGLCNSGILFQENKNKKWFKNSDGTFDQEVVNGAAKNFRCQNVPLSTYESVPKIRGVWIGIMIEVAEWMAKQIREGKGVIDQANLFNSTTLSKCTLMRAEIQAYRIWNRMQFDKLYDSEFKPCNSASASSAVCYWDANLRLTELDYVSEYSYCVWESYADEIYKRLLMF